MVKRAVLIRCNYPGTKAKLKGCVNDVRRTYTCLIERYGFPKENITVLIDADDSYAQPTGRNILDALVDLVASAEPGDFLCIHYSGHGTRLLTDTGDDDDTGYDECIVPTDMNLISDDDFRELVDQVPKGSRITIVSDSCHRAGLINNSKEQIGESTKNNKKENSGSTGFGFKIFLRKSVEDAIESRGVHIPSELKLGHHRPRHHQDDETYVQGQYGYVKDKSLPLSILIEILKQKTSKNDIDVGKLRPTLFDLFGKDSSPKINKFMKVILSKLQGGGGIGVVLGIVGGLTVQYLQHKLEENGEYYLKPATETHVGSENEVYAGSAEGSLHSNDILLSGCQTDQTSADISPSGDPLQAYGALSNAMQTIIAEMNGRVSNRELVIKTRELLMKQGFAQRPGLYCSDDYVDAPFVC